MPLTSDQLDRLRSLLRHIKTVRDNCELLGMRLIEDGEVELGRQLLAESLDHDKTKFQAKEWYGMILVGEGEDLKIAIEQHNQSNDHHPEHWPGGIHEMPLRCVAEMVCDFVARSSEFGTNVREWVKKKATQRYGFEMNDEVGKKINRFLDMLLAKPFD